MKHMYHGYFCIITLTEVTEEKASFEDIITDQCFHFHISETMDQIVWRTSQTYPLFTY